MNNRLHEFANQGQALVCPICKGILINHESKSMVCPAGHSFDFAKEGYLHLLPANKMKSKIPGDNAEMISARSKFLEAGFYEQLVIHIQAIVPAVTRNKGSTAIDIGCGTGFYTNKVLNSTASFGTVLGTDISKHAVKTASKAHKQTQYFVSSAFELPVSSGSIDLALSVFAPLQSSEVHRILKMDGSLLVIYPGPEHLRELAEIIYENFRPHVSSTREKLSSQFMLQAEAKSNFQITLSDPVDILNLLKMTPYYWNKDRQKVEKLSALTNLSLTSDFQIDLFAPK